jgi:hypothetical protein
VSDHEQPEDNKPMIGSPVPQVFPPDDPAARFVVAMSMARNDIDRVFRDLLRAGEEDGQDFTYRIRLVTGHLVEAIDSLKRYRDTFPAVRQLLDRIPPADAKKLTAAASSPQKAGAKALQDVRDNTFHYPSPNPKYGTTSDEKLRDVLALMTDRGVSFHFDGDTLATTMSFADEAALDLAMGRTTATANEALRRSEIARDGALAFRDWVNALIRAYIDANGLTVGEAVITDKSSTGLGRSDGAVVRGRPLAGDGPTPLRSAP